MSQIRIDQVGTRKSGALSEADIARRRLELHATSSYEAERRTFAGIGKADLSALRAQKTDDAKKVEEAEESLSFRTKDGEVIELYGMTAEDRRRAERLLEELPVERRTIVEGAARELAAKAFAEVAPTGEPVLGSFSSGLMDASNVMYENYVATTTQSQQEQMITNGVLLGVSQAEQNLTGYFKKVMREQGIAQDVRTDIAELDAALADWPDDGSTQTFSYREVKFNEDGSTSVIEHKDVELTKEQAMALKRELEQMTESLGQIETRDTFVIQKMMHDWKSAQETISNVLKAQHETHKTLLQNAKA
jgi:hypothetical protein